MANHFNLLLLLALCVISVSGNVFVSIDCGASNLYTDENSIVWMGDNDLIQNGDTQVVQSSNSISRVMDTLRVFTTRKKNCYVIKVDKGGQILVRASFNYGNYDKKSSPPTFDLHFDGNLWASVETSSSGVQIYEATYVVKGDTTSVCFAQTKPTQFPFVSALEVRRLDDNMYGDVNASYALFLRNRVAYGTNQIIRYPADPYDRMWLPAIIGNGLINVSNNALLIDDKLTDNPPQVVLQNAITTENISFNVITLGTNAPADVPAYINWYFSELQEFSSTDLRSFRIFEDARPFSMPIVPPFGNVSEYSVSNHTTNSNTNFSLVATSDSTLPPLINAMEVFSISGILTNGTDSNDVEGLDSLQTTFNILNEWGGDPCLPAPYSWEWINCSTDATPRVTALHLSSFGLSGTLPDISSMDALEIIDLRNNSLTGPIPDFLGTLTNLKQLNLADNDFRGPIPVSLSKNNKVNLIVTGNPSFCTSGKSCDTINTPISSSNGGSKKKSSKLPIILGIAIPLFFIFWAILGVVLIMHKRRKAGMAAATGAGQMGGVNGVNSKPQRNGITEMVGKVGEEMTNEFKVNMEEQAINAEFSGQSSDQQGQNGQYDGRNSYN